ncbi:hypothetical protein AB4Y44_09925 [Paraburkholderia sp. BR10937]|uniref:hypothetical protein n=1 Tax=Paraburkholderia sp. BR10937 TaxID=3236994 RepID=UPI0034D24EE1
MRESDHVSAQQKKRVEAILEKKIAVLQSWAREGVPWMLTADAKLARDTDGHPMLVHYPRDIRSFACWDGSLYTASDIEKNPGLSELKRFARSTLVQKHNLDNHTRVKHLLREICLKASRQLEELDFGGRIRKLEREIESLKATIVRQESEIDIFRTEADEERQRRVKSEKRLDRIRKYAREKIEQLERDRATGSTPTSSANVVSLRKQMHTRRRPQ